MTPTVRNHRRRPAARHGQRTAIASLEDVERAHVRLVLEQTATFEEDAELLGINLATLWRAEAVGPQLTMAVLPHRTQAPVRTWIHQAA